jgi:hypothetical protein
MAMYATFIPIYAVESFVLFPFTSIFAWYLVLVFFFFLPVYKISSLKITPPKTPNSGQFSYPLPNIVSFLFKKKSTRVPA